MASSKIKLLIVLLLCAAGAQAQTFAEWFSQGKTQIKYLQQQIMALVALESSTKQCYNMLHSEWSMIGSLKNGEFLLHQGYYTSLTQINPQVKSNVNLTDVQSQQQSILSQFNSINNVAGLSFNEQTYVGIVQQNLLTELNKNLTDLQTVMAPGKLTMSDDERIKRINQLTAAIKDEYLFTCNFCNQVRILAIQHNQENNESQTFNQVYGNP